MGIRGKPSDATADCVCGFRCGGWSGLVRSEMEWTKHTQSETKTPMEEVCMTHERKRHGWVWDVYQANYEALPATDPMGPKPTRNGWSVVVRIFRC